MTDKTVLNWDYDKDEVIDLSERLSHLNKLYEYSQDYKVQPEYMVLPSWAIGLFFSTLPDDYNKQEIK